MLQSSAAVWVSGIGRCVLILLLFDDRIVLRRCEGLWQLLLLLLRAAWLNVGVGSRRKRLRWRHAWLDVGLHMLGLQVLSVISGPLKENAMDALREAAAILLEAASPAIVRSVLRMLLDDTPPEAAPVQASRATPPARPHPTKPKQTQPKQADIAWDARRREIRAAMLEREIGYAELAKQFRVPVKTLHTALGRRQPPALALRQRLEAWLATSAPAVAAEPPTFRPNGADRSHPDAAAAG